LAQEHQSTMKTCRADAIVSMRANEVGSFAQCSDLFAYHIHAPATCWAHVIALDYNVPEYSLKIEFKQSTLEVSTAHCFRYDARATLSCMSVQKRFTHEVEACVTIELVPC
jgi:hypothetical protein